MSADETRERTIAGWDASAVAWSEQTERWEQIAAPVTERLLDLAALAPGQRVLELGAGTGETGRRAAERVAPDGSVVITDPAPGMVEQARARAESVPNVEVAEENAEWIDRPTASFDAVIARWSLMFAYDVGAAVRECRRVLKPGGRLVLATWTTREENAWLGELSEELLEQGLIDPPDDGPETPGPFRLGDPDRIRELLEDAGFVAPEVERFPFRAAYRDVEDYWVVHTAMSASAREALERTNDRGRAALRDGLAARLERHAADGGRLELPACALLACAAA